MAEARACLEKLKKAVPDAAGKKPPSTEVERLLEACEMHFAANRLTTGVGGTAVQCYREVQSLDPANRKALEGLQRVFGKYVTWARAALQRGDVVRARGHIEKLNRLNPEAPEVAEVEGAIARLERQAAEAREAESEAGATCDGWNSRIFFRATTPEGVKMCLRAGAEPNVRDRYGNTPLHRAAAYSKNPAVIAALIDAGADRNAENRSSFTPLHLAARYNENLAVVATLLKAGADPNVRNRDGKTPEDLAFLNKYFRVLAVAKLFEAEE